MKNTRTTRAPTLALTIADRIRSAIVSAELKFGESLSEDTLATAFEVSRTPVREALNILEMEDLVNIIPKSGTYVFKPNQDDIAELCDYRAGLETHAASLALRSDDVLLLVGTLETNLALMTAAIEQNDMPAYGRADTDFHLAFFFHCGNRYLERAYGLILGRVAALRTHLAMSAEGEPNRSYQDHKMIIRLVQGREEESLSRLLTEHVLRTKANYLTAFEKLSPLTADSRADRLRRRLAIAD